MMVKIDDPMAAVSWRTGWFCITIRDRLARDGHHVTVDLPELSVTVQNFRGELRGFWNVCAHRGTQMRHAGCGVGPLRCPYHGWVYNGHGVPVGIPDNDLLFGLDHDARQGLKLRPVEVATFGRFVFVRVDTDPETLVGALEGLATVLAETPNSSHVLSQSEGLAELSGEATAVHRNLRVHTDRTRSRVEITLPQGRHGTVVERFDFIAP